MLLSESKKFVFIHIQKTGGTSLRMYFNQLIPDLEVSMGDTPKYHGRLSDLMKIDPRLRCGEYFTAAFVRNPWDRLVSWYTDIVVNYKLLPSLDPRYIRLRQGVLRKAQSFENFSFEDFIYYCSDLPDRTGRTPFLDNQIDYLTDMSGNLAVDFIGRFENFEESVTALSRTLGLPNPAKPEPNAGWRKNLRRFLEGFTGKRPKVEIPHLNTSQHDEYRRYYTEKTKEIIRTRFRRDIEEFGYTF